jgi:hypothetical protein
MSMAHHNMIQGVPYIYSAETDEYVLPNGERFHVINDMAAYVSNMLTKFGWDVFMEILKEETPASTTASTSSVPSTIKAENLVKKMTESMERLRGVSPRTPIYNDWSSDPFSDFDETVAKKERRMIENHNRREQLKWDKKFNRKVLDLVGQAVAAGGLVVRVAKVQPFELHAADDERTIAPKIEEHSIIYDAWDPDQNAAYLRCREQAEAIVKTMLPPPKLVPIS